MHSEEVYPRVRQHLWTTFDPSLQCILLMEELCEGIEGIEGITRSFQEGSTVILVLRQDVDPAETARQFIRSFKSCTNKMHDDVLQELKSGLILPKTAMAVTSESATWQPNE